MSLEASLFFQVWNFQNGHNLHKLESVSEAEVTGIFPCADRKIIISVGWSRKIAEYDDSDPDVSLQYDIKLLTPSLLGIYQKLFMAWCKSIFHVVYTMYLFYNQYVPYVR